MQFRVKSAIIAVVLALWSAGGAEAGLLVSDSAVPVETGHAEVELNGTYTIDKARSSGVTAKCHSTDSNVTITAGLADGAAIAVALPYTITSREKIGGTLAKRSDGLNDMTVDLKFRLLDRNGLKLAIRPGLILPTGKSSEGLSDGRIGLATALLATKEFAGGTMLLHVNGGYAWRNYRNAAIRGTTRADIFTGSVAGETEVAPGLTLAADIGLATASDKTVTTPPVYGLVGATYAINGNLDVYAGCKAGLTRTEDDFSALFGVIFKF
jgi:hypothetical protein